MKDIMMSQGLVSRIDVTADTIPVVVAAKFISDSETIELIGNFVNVKYGTHKVLEFTVPSSDNPFNIFGSNQCEAIIKNNGKNLFLEFDISSIEISGGNILTIRIESEGESNEN